MRISPFTIIVAVILLNVLIIGGVTCGAVKCYNHVKEKGLDNIVDDIRKGESISENVK